MATTTPIDRRQVQPEGAQGTGNHSSQSMEFPRVDPFAPRRKLIPSLTEALLATALFRCWHILIFFAAWSTAVAVISNSVYDLGIQSTLLTVFGTVLGFVISYRTTSSFERYNEGRRYWSQIILASRTLGRAIWFQLPEIPQSKAADDKNRTEEERRARVLIEKKAVINLIEAFAVSVKHYLRGEEGINYVDLYHLIKYLPSYALPAGMPSNSQLDLSSDSSRSSDSQSDGNEIAITIEAPPLRPVNTDISYLKRSLSQNSQVPPPSPSAMSTRARVQQFLSPFDEKRSTRMQGDDVLLMDARNPPRFHIFDLFPFSLLVKFLERRGMRLKGKKAARYRARNHQDRSTVVNHNIPFEITLYMTSYIAALAARESIGVPMHNLLIASVGQLTDALTGLERILTTPIPFSYSMHLWLVTIVYCLALPFQIWPTLKWVTIPATTIASFIFFGFLVAGEEIENPFGYDKNDLNMDHFTNGIIRHELMAMTSRPPPNISEWAFSDRNDRLFPVHTGPNNILEHVTPNEWIQRGSQQIQIALASSQ